MPRRLCAARDFFGPCTRHVQTSLPLSQPAYCRQHRSGDKSLYGPRDRLMAWVPRRLFNWLKAESLQAGIPRDELVLRLLDSAIAAYIVRVPNAEPLPEAITPGQPWWYGKDE